MNEWKSIDAWRESDVNDDVFVLVEHGEKRFYGSFFQKTIAGAAEEACARYVLKSGTLIPNLQATVYWKDGSVYGPFDVLVKLVTEAKGLRGKV